MPDTAMFQTKRQHTLCLDRSGDPGHAVVLYLYYVDQPLDTGSNFQNV